MNAVYTLVHHKSILLVPIVFEFCVIKAAIYISTNQLAF